MPFHNPYNFIPVLPRDDMPDGLGDSAPVGHHRWHPDRWSGEITVSMEVVTPLLLMRERETVNEHRHLEVATTLDADGKRIVDLAPTQIKGMLRAAYEAVTNSRLSVFAHDEPMGYRSEVEEAAKLTPALVRPDGRVVELGKLSVKGVGSGSAAVSVPAWQHDPERRPTPLLHGRAHGDQVDALVEYSEQNRGWKVVSLHDLGSTPAPSPGRHAVRGWLHITGPSIKGKLAERLFVTEVLGDKPAMEQERDLERPSDQSDRLVAGLRQLVEHQRDIHRHTGGDEVWATDKRPWEYRGSDPGRTAWSRHLYEVSQTEHAPPSWVGPDIDLPPPAGRVVTCWKDADGRLRPVMVSRLRYNTAAADLLHPSLHPAGRIEELSPADRLFGWTWARSQRTPDRPEPAAHRAQLRVLRVESPPAEEAIEELGELTIPPLATPKPSQGRFYLAPKNPAAKAPNRGKLFGDAQQLRGRKIYPQHRAAAELDTEKRRDYFRYLPPLDPETRQARPERDAQNATLHSWVRPTTRFRFVLQVVDAHPAELGALLWLLDPTRSGTADAPARHRIGMGKPLGFGAVELSVQEVRVSTGDQIRDRLTMLMPAADPADPDVLAERFEKAMTDRFAVILAGLRAALAGYPANAAVSYPRMRTPRSPGYAWFVKNESSDRRWLSGLGGPPMSEYEADLKGKI